MLPRGKNLNLTKEGVIRQHLGVEFGKSQKISREVICGTPLTILVKGLMIMIMIMFMSTATHCYALLRSAGSVLPEGPLDTARQYINT